MIWVYSIQKDEAPMAPYFLRHYGSFADKIIIYDGGSTDGTRDIFKKHPKVEIRTSTGIDKLDDRRFHEISETCYQESRGKADWVMFVDADEFIYHPRLQFYLDSERANGVQVLRPFGYNMIAAKFIRDETRQIYELMPMGIAAPVYSKPVVFDPNLDMHWKWGKHELSGADASMVCGAILSELKLLHYRYLNEAFTRERNARNWSRVPSENRRGGFGWTNNPAHHGEHSPEWSAAIQRIGFDVVNSPNDWGNFTVPDD